MCDEFDVIDVFVQYLERIVRHAKGGVVTFSASTIVNMWGKWFNHGRAPTCLLHKMSRLLSRLASCNLLQRYKLYKYQLRRGTPLWDAAERGRLKSIWSASTATLLWRICNMDTRRGGRINDVFFHGNT